MMHPSHWPGAVPPARPSVRGRLRHQLAIVLALLLVGLLAGLTRSARGLLAIGLAWLLVAVLASHRDRGGRRQAARTLVEYGLVAAVTALVLTAVPSAPAAPERKPAARPRPPAAKEITVQVDPLAKVRAIFEQAKARVPEVRFETTTKEAR